MSVNGKLHFVCPVISSQTNRDKRNPRSHAFKCLYIASIPASNNLFKVNNVNIRPLCEICSKSTLKKTEQHHCSGVFIVDVEYVNSDCIYMYVYMYISVISL